jgi:hypothetical protein
MLTAGLYARATSVSTTKVIDPVLGVLRLHREGFRRVRDFAVILDHAERRRHAGGRTKRDDGRRGNARVVERIDARLCDGSGTRGMRLEIPVRFVQRLPDAAQVRPALDARRPRGLRPLRIAGCRLSGCPRDPNESSMGVKLVTSMTSVLPSQWPRESPENWRMLDGRCGVPFIRCRSTEATTGETRDRRRPAPAPRASAAGCARSADRQ